MPTTNRVFPFLKRASPSRDLVLTIVGCIVGWGISHFYYVRALDDMKADAEERRRIDELVFRGVEAIGAFKYSRDASGRVIGVVIELKAQAFSQATTTGDLNVTPKLDSAR